MKNDCLFCAIIDGEIPSNKVYEDELCYAFYDIEPQAPTHFLVSPFGCPGQTLPRLLWGAAAGRGPSGRAAPHILPKEERLVPF